MIPNQLIPITRILLQIALLPDSKKYHLDKGHRNVDQVVLEVVGHLIEIKGVGICRTDK